MLAPIAGKKNPTHAPDAVSAMVFRCWHRRLTVYALQIGDRIFVLSLFRFCRASAKLWAIDRQTGRTGKFHILWDLRVTRLSIELRRGTKVWTDFCLALSGCNRPILSRRGHHAGGDNRNSFPARPHQEKCGTGNLFSSSFLIESVASPMMEGAGAAGNSGTRMPDLLA